MNPDNPFDDGELDATVRRPRTGGRPTPVAAARTAPPPRSIGEDVVTAFRLAYSNPLLATAGPLLWLAGQLRDSATQTDVEELRELTIAEVRRFETAALTAGQQPELIRLARYALCATIDDLVLNTPWGGQSGWAAKGLVSTIYGETWGGERFFDLLPPLMQEPHRNADLLELVTVCLAIGFTGKYRVMPRGQAELGRLRTELQRTLRRVRGAPETQLSPQWRGQAIPYRAPAPLISLRLIAGAAVFVLLVVFAAFRFTLDVATDTVVNRLDQLPPELLRTPPAPPPSPPPAPTLTQLQRLEAALASDIAAGRVELSQDARTITIRLHGTGMFDSAQADLDDAYQPTLQRVGQTLKTEPGDFVIEGYTDNSRLVKSRLYKSNQELSLARAQTVEKLLVSSGVAPTHLRSEGRGDADPIQPNTTPAGRAANRRIEILVPRSDRTPP